MSHISPALQAQFASALFDPASAVPPGVTSWNGSDPGQRFAVYRNNVTVSLIEALGAAYPVVREHVGEDFFREVARLYLRKNPPKSPLMMEFGGGFGDFLADFPPVQGLPYLADLARLELARREAYHAADAEPLGPEAFQHLGPEALSGLRVSFHPSARLIASPFAVVSLWAAHQLSGDARDAALAELVLEQPEAALILRPAFEVEVMALPPGGFSFFGALQAGQTLSEAALILGEAAPETLPVLLGILTAQGLATAISA